METKDTFRRRRTGQKIGSWIKKKRKKEIFSTKKTHFPLKQMQGVGGPTATVRERGGGLPSRGKKLKREKPVAPFAVPVEGIGKREKGKFP